MQRSELTIDTEIERDDKGRRAVLSADDTNRNSPKPGQGRLPGTANAGELAACPLCRPGAHWVKFAEQKRSSTSREPRYKSRIHLSAALVTSTSTSDGSLLSVSSRRRTSQLTSLSCLSAVKFPRGGQLLSLFLTTQEVLLETVERGARVLSERDSKASFGRQRVRLAAARGKGMHNVASCTADVSSVSRRVYLRDIDKVRHIEEAHAADV